ncbi:MAG: hypothetical protein ABI364_09575 [Caldimonas sp.]
MKLTPRLALTSGALALAAGAGQAQTLGAGGSLANGAAGPNGSSQGASDLLEHCDTPADFATGGALLGGIAAAGGGYGNTPECKVVVASFLDNWNNIVRNIRNNPSLVQAHANVASQQNAAMSVKRNAAAAGDVMVPKIHGVKVLRQPRDGGGDLQTLTRNDEMIVAGEEQNGYTEVTTSRGDGWVKTVLLKKT